MCLSTAAGWLLDITKLTLGENIGEGEFGGELSLVLSTHNVHNEKVSGNITRKKKNPSY